MNTPTITIRNKRYRVNTKRFGYVALASLLVVMFVSHQTHQLFFKSDVTEIPFENTSYTAVKTETQPISSIQTNTIEKNTPSSSSDLPSINTEPPKTPSIMSVSRFVGQAEQLFPKVPSDYFSAIYHQALENDLPPYLALGIAWQESRFNPNAKGPATRFGTARGLFQIIESTASHLLNIKDPQQLYTPDTAIAGGTKILGIYRNWLSGKVDNKTPDVLTHFSVVEGAVYYKGKPVLDHKGDTVPLLLMTAISYNGGPGVITAALKKDGVLVMDPSAKNCNIPTQSLDYVYQIQQNLYNFEYDFKYTNSDIDRSKIF